MLSIPVQEIVKTEGFDIQNYDPSADEEYKELYSYIDDEDRLADSRLEDFSLINKAEKGEKEAEGNVEPSKKRKDSLRSYKCI